MCLTSAIPHHAAKHDVFDTSSLFFILHPLLRASKWDTSAESKNHHPSPQTERFVCCAVIGKQIDGENIKSIAFTWLLFKMLILATQMLLISFSFLSLSFSLCLKKALGFSLFKTKYNNNSFNGKYWLRASVKEEACHKCGFVEMNGAFLIPFIVYLPEMRRVGGEGGGIARDYSRYYIFVAWPRMSIQSSAFLFCDAIMDETRQ